MNATPALDIALLKIVPLPSDSAFAGFSSGERAIDRNLTQCCAWHKCYRSRVFCAYLASDPYLYGFYCLGLHAHRADAIDGFFERASDDVRNFVPFIYLNFLAVRQEWQRRKIGTMLLMNALEKCSGVIQRIGAYGVALNALNDVSAALYDKYGFKAKKPMRRCPLMVLPAQSILDLFPT